MDPLARYPQYFSLFGTVHQNKCPLCESEDIGEIWRLPQTRLSKIAYLDAPGTPFDRTYIGQLPLLLTPQLIYRFDICGACETIFLNPRNDDQAAYADSASKVARFKQEGAEDYRDGALTMIKAFPAGTRRVVDAGCGAGQMLSLLKELAPDVSLCGLEISEPCVSYIRDELGIEAHCADLDRDDLSPLLPDGSVDFAIFYDTFEHARAPLVILRKLMRALRPGGRLYFTAQFYGNNEMQIRVGEPLYISQETLRLMVSKLDATLLDLKTDNKMRVLLEKPLAA